MILIVGAGPTGLTLAIELARRGVPFRLIDREVVPPMTSRAIGTQPRTVEVFRMMGILPGALQPVARPRAFQFMEGARLLVRLAFGDGPDEPSPPIIMDEADTERVLTERLALAGGAVERGVELESFRYDGDGVVATLAGPRGVEEMPARFLAGCDGAGSIVRRQAAIEFAGSSYPEQFLLADLDLDWQIPHDVGTVWLGDEHGIAAAIPLPAERRWRIIVAVPRIASSPDRFTAADAAVRAEDELRNRSGIPLRRIGDPAWASAFHIHRRLAEHYRAGPVFLAGDAAHVHSPIGGQGMNTGIQDAFNLGWKLALAAGNQAAPELLDTYERERRPVARAVLQGTNLGQQLVFGASPAARALRDTLLPAAVRFEPVRDRILAAISELGIDYRGSPLSVDADNAEGWRTFLGQDHGLRAGDRVPDIALRAGDGASVSLFELFSGGWTLLLLAGNAPTPQKLNRLAAIADDTAAAAGETVQRALVVPTPVAGEIDATTLVDTAGAASSVFAAPEGLVALVRPDGYLGFRGRPDQPGALAVYLARVFAMRVRGVSEQVAVDVAAR